VTPTTPAATIRPSTGPTPPARGEVVRSAVAGWGFASVAAVASFIVVALGGQLLALAVGVAGGPGSGELTPLIGWLYVCAFQHVPIVVEAVPTAVGGAVPATPTELSGTIAVTMLGGTAAAAAVLTAAGGRVAARAGGGPLVRALHGAKVAPLYAIASFAVSSLATVHLPLPENPVIAEVAIRPSAVGSLAWPLALAAASGAAGGWWSARHSARSRRGTSPWFEAIAAGALRMFVAAVGLSGCALVALAILAPDSVAAPVQRLAHHGAAPLAVSAVHAVLLLPNASVTALAPAMGGCDGVYGAGVSLDAICLDRFPADLSLRLFTPESGPAPVIGDAPAIFFVLVLVPAAAAVLGGVEVARRAGSSSPAMRAAFGGGAGLVFAMLLSVAAYLAGVRVSGDLFDGAARGVVVYGARPFEVGALAAVWGAAGGALGAIIGVRRAPWGRSQP
jgi:hypothetical protein